MRACRSYPARADYHVVAFPDVLMESQSGSRRFATMRSRRQLLRKRAKKQAMKREPQEGDMTVTRGLHLLCILAMAAAASGQAATPAPVVNIESLRMELGSTAEEWKVVGPLLQKVAAARRALEPAYAPPPPAGRGFFGPADWANGSFTGPGETARGTRPAGGFGRAATAPGAQTQAAVASPADAAADDESRVRPLTESITVHQALADLHAALQKPEADDAALKRQVALVREARQRAREALADARAELLPLLTARQEAALEANGFLEE
jgi:hypothetical protein